MSASRQSDTQRWLTKNVELIAQAQEIIGQHFENPYLCEHTATGLCDEVFAVVRGCLGGAGGGESGSVLILGEAGSGKSHAVEKCLQRLREEQGATTAVVLRAHGGAYGTDVECMRHLASQVAQKGVEFPDGNASFEQILEWLRSVMKESFKQAGAAVIVLDRFEHFCSRSRQTLLYNLFDVAQEADVRICIVGMSEKVDVTSLLEKRIKSRFSMRQTYAFQPKNFEDLVNGLMTKLRLPPSCGLRRTFVTEFNKHVEAAVRAHQPQWQPEVDLVRPMSWFLSKCVPVSALLWTGLPLGGPGHPSGAPPAKRPRTVRGSFTATDVNDMLLRSLSEIEHIVMTALFRIRDRSLSATLSLTLHEIELLHRNFKLVFPFDADTYSRAFERLLQMKLVGIRSPGKMDAGKRHVQCESLVHGVYFDYVSDLERPETTLHFNPLRSLPGEVQQWAARQRQGGQVS